VKYVAPILPGELEELRTRIEQELRQIELTLNDLEMERLFLTELHEAPKKSLTGMVVLADGTDWDPASIGGGQYITRYNGSTWIKVG